MLLLSILALRLLSLMLLDRPGRFNDLITLVGISEMVVLPFNPPLSGEWTTGEMVPGADKDEMMSGEGVDVRPDEAVDGSIGDEGAPPVVFGDGADVALMDAFNISASIDTFSIQHLVSRTRTLLVERCLSLRVPFSYMTTGLWPKVVQSDFCATCCEGHQLHFQPFLVCHWRLCSGYQRRDCQGDFGAMLYLPRDLLGNGLLTPLQIAVHVPVLAIGLSPSFPLKAP